MEIEQMSAAEIQKEIEAAGYVFLSESPMYGKRFRGMTRYDLRDPFGRTSIVIGWQTVKRLLADIRAGKAPRPLSADEQATRAEKEAASYRLSGMIWKGSWEPINEVVEGLQAARARREQLRSEGAVVSGFDRIFEWEKDRD